MSKQDRPFSRRSFISTVSSVAALTTLSSVSGAGSRKDKTAEKLLAQMPLGIISKVTDPDADIARVRKLGFGTCQIVVEDYSDEYARRIRDGLAKHAVTPTSLICMGPGPYRWNFYEGPPTIGLIPRAYRAERIDRLKRGAEFCRIAGIPALLAHFGFIPEDPNDVLYVEFIDVMKDVAAYAAERGVRVDFETGQETPVTLLRAIEDIGTENLGVNYDTANLILYGKANPVDGLDVVGKYVRSLHAKDGLYPTNPRELGKEVPIGEGKVDFPAVIRKLKALRFGGHITIEREISGPRRLEDIMKSKAYLESLITSR